VIAGISTTMNGKQEAHSRKHRSLLLLLLLRHREVAVDDEYVEDDGVAVNIGHLLRLYQSLLVPYCFFPFPLFQLLSLSLYLLPYGDV